MVLPDWSATLSLRNADVHMFQVRVCDYPKQKAIVSVNTEAKQKNKKTVPRLTIPNLQVAQQAMMGHHFARSSQS